MKPCHSSLKSRGCLLPVLFLFTICGSTLADSKANWYYQNCPAHQGMTLNDNVNQIVAILDAQSTWVPDGHFQDAMTAYLGPKSSDDSSWTYSYLEVIQAQFKQLRAGFKTQTSVDPYKSYDLYIYCNSYNWRESPCALSGGVISAGWSRYGWRPWSYYYWVALCDGFWARPDLKTILAETDKYAQSDPRMHDMNTYFPTKTHYLMAAVDSLDAISVPQGSFKSVTPWDTYQGVLKGGTAWAYKNCFSYVFAATAVFIKRRYSLVNPPIPNKPGLALLANDPAITPQVLNITGIPTQGFPTVSGALPNPSDWISLPPGDGAAYENIIYSTTQMSTVPTLRTSTVPSSTSVTGRGDQNPGDPLGEPPFHKNDKK